MTLKAWFKSKTADKLLSPLRDQLVDQIDPGSSLLEIGCGTGDLLFRAASKFDQGVGLDLDHVMIRYAENRRAEQNLENISFECADALTMRPRFFDISTATLCLHEMPGDHACALLDMMVTHSGKVLIADFTRARSLRVDWASSSMSC